MTYIINYLVTYFSDLRHCLFWGLVLVFSLYESLKKKWKSRNYFKLWMKEHNIGRKYWF